MWTPKINEEVRINGGVVARGATELGLSSGKNDHEKRDAAPILPPLPRRPELGRGRPSGHTRIDHLQLPRAMSGGNAR